MRYVLLVVLLSLARVAQAGPASAVNQARALVASHPDDPAAANELGLALLAAGSKTDALTAFKSSVALTEKQLDAMSANEQMRVCWPQVVARYLNYGTLLREQGQASVAEEALKRIANNRRTGASTYVLRVELAKAAEAAGHYKDAAEDLEPAQMPLVWPSEDCTTCYRQLGPQICGSNRAAYADPVVTVRLRPGLPEPGPSPLLLGAKMADLYLKSGDIEKARGMWLYMGKKLDNPNTKLTDAERRQLAEAVRKGLADADGAERAKKEKLEADEAARVAQASAAEAEKIRQQQEQTVREKAAIPVLLNEAKRLIRANDPDAATAQLDRAAAFGGDVAELREAVRKTPAYLKRERELRRLWGADRPIEIASRAAETHTLPEWMLLSAESSRGDCKDAALGGTIVQRMGPRLYEAIVPLPMGMWGNGDEDQGRARHVVLRTTKSAFTSDGHFRVCIVDQYAAKPIALKNGFKQDWILFVEDPR